MKILENCVVRDMTAEEEAAFLASVEENATADDYENALESLGVKLHDES